MKLRNGRQLPALDLLASEELPIEVVRTLADTMLTAAHGLGAPPVTDVSRRDLRAYDAVRRVLAELEQLGHVDREDVLVALEHATVRETAPRRRGGWRCSTWAVLARAGSRRSS